jgi:hypothetical protein
MFPSFTELGHSIYHEEAKSGIEVINAKKIISSNE